MTEDDNDSLYPYYFGAVGALSLYWLTIPREQKVPDLTGKRVIITGASSGIGKGLTEVCATAGGHVIMAVRDVILGEKVKDSIINKYRNKKLSIDVEELDLQSLESIDKFASTQSNVDVLINNAGILQPKHTLHAAKSHLLFESTMLTNYVGPFYLTMRLLPSLINSAKLNNSYSHIINVSSKLEKNANITMSNFKTIFDGKSDNYSCWDAYAETKLLNIMFTIELQKRLLHNKVVAVAVTPGLVNTSLDRHVSHPLMRYVTYPFKHIFLKSPETSALAIVNLTALTPPGDVDSKVIPYYSNMKAMQPANKVFEDNGATERLAEEIFNYTMDRLGLSK